MNELERRLAEAAPHYPFPETPRIAAAVAARLPARQRRPRPVVLAPAAAVLAAATAVLALSPGARSAVLDWLDAIPGVRIERVEELPTSRLLPGADFAAGRKMSLAAARSRAGFTVRLPRGIGEPSAVYFDRNPGGTVVTLRYGERLVLSEWRSNVILFDKLLLANTPVEETRVGGNRAAWIAGGDHAVFYIGTEDTSERERLGFLAGNVLLWQDGLIGYRLETAAAKDRALELADSLRP